MHGKLTLFEHIFTGAVGPPTLETLEVERVDGYTNKPAIILDVARPRNLQFLTFEANVCYSIQQPIGRLDVAPWLHNGLCCNRVGNRRKRLLVARSEREEEA